MQISPNNTTIVYNSSIFLRKNRTNNHKATIESFTKSYSTNKIVSFTGPWDYFKNIFQNTNGEKITDIDFDRDYRAGMAAIEEEYRVERQRIIDECFFQKRKLKKLDDEMLKELRGYRRYQELTNETMRKTLELQQQSIAILTKLNAKDARINDLEMEAHRTRQVAKIQEERLAKSDSYSGFRKIAGYEEEKFILEDTFVKPLLLEKAGIEANLPNGILFFGPTGTGKSTFATALSEETGCTLVKITPPAAPTRAEKEAKYFADILTKAQESQDRFLNNNNRTRTIILLDEFDGIANENSSILPDLKCFLETCSEEFHCTIFATTNKPNKISMPILSDHRMSVRIPQGPCDKKIAVSLLKHYLEGNRKTGNIDYDAVADQIIKPYPNAAYSNSEIEMICKKSQISIGEDYGEDYKVTTETLIDLFAKTTPGISKEDLIKFEEEKTLYRSQL